MLITRREVASQFVMSYPGGCCCLC